MSDLDLSALSHELITSALNGTIEQQLKTTEFETSIEPASKKGDNFVGIVYRVTCTPKQDDQAEAANLKLILKVAPQHEQRREMFHSRPCFLREMYLFNEILPFFRSLEESKGIVFEEDGFNQYPICYRTVDTAPYETLVLEDLGASGFVMIDKLHGSLTADHVNLVMAALGKFHAFSFALRDQQPEKLQQVAKQLPELFLRFNDENMKKWMNNFGPAVTAQAKSMGDDRITAKVEEMFSGDVMQRISEYVDGSRSEPYSVICHGDCWNNNTMFRLNEDGTPTELRLLDYQIARYASPVLDLVFYIFCNTQQELRDQHYDSFLRVYYESLTKHLERLGSDVEKLFPYSALLDQLQQFGRFGAFIAAMFLPMLTADADAVPDMDALAEDVKNGKEFDENMFKSENSEKRLLARLKGVWQDMDRLGYM